MVSEELTHLKSLLEEISKNDLNLNNKNIEDIIDSSLIEIYSTEFLNDKNNFLSVKNNILALTKNANFYNKLCDRVCIFSFLGLPFLFFVFFAYIVYGYGNELKNSFTNFFIGSSISVIVPLITFLFFIILKQGKNHKKIKSLYDSIFGVSYKKEITEITLRIIKNIELINDIELTQSKKYLTNYLLKNLKDFGTKKIKDNNFFVRIQNHIDNKVFADKKDITDKKIKSLESNPLLNLDLTSYHKELLKEKMEHKI